MTDEMIFDAIRDLDPDWQPSREDEARSVRAVRCFALTTGLCLGLWAFVAWRLFR